jgi:hypothetical protein
LATVYHNIESKPALGIAQFGITICLAAFLLFQVEPLIAKQILPWFGGSAAVWTTCLLFFQITLLVGYLYAHLLTLWLAPRRQVTVHCAMLWLSLLCLPIIPNTWWRPSGSEDPTVRILGLLCLTIGWPYLMLSSTSPLLQRWMDRAGTVSSPYRFFSLSNLGSLLALLSYPVLVEPNLTNEEQAWAWSAGYALFAILSLSVSYRMKRSFSGERIQVVDDSICLESPTIRTCLIWVSLAASASALLLSITSYLTENVASIPFLWVLPLAVYLVTFILCFDGRGWYQRALFLPLFAISIGTLAWGVREGFGDLGFRQQIAICLACLFVCCIVCHGELARTKPATRYLTRFYLMVSLGGAIGGLFVAFLAPHVFSGFYEFPISIIGASLTIVAVYPKCQLVLGPWKLPRWWAWLASFCLIVLLGTQLYQSEKDAADHLIYRGRNFYGILRINDSDDEDPVRTLLHGTINHGEEYLDSAGRREPTTYYGRETGIGRALEDLQTDGPLKVGVIGLGTGTIAAYSRPIDTYRFYEINPLVAEIAAKYFHYLDDSKAKLDVVLGDARLTLEREPPQNFDVLALDAFSSDSIPVHLLTKEAFLLYWTHIKPSGILAVHISNHFLDLGPVVAQQARALGKSAILIANDDNDDEDVLAATWILVTTNPTSVSHLAQFSSAIEEKTQLRIWTDDYSNLFQILK